MNNLITKNNSNILNTDEGKNNASFKPSGPEFCDKFNKIFQNAKNRQNELTERSFQVDVARKNTPVKDFLTSKKSTFDKVHQEPVEKIDAKASKKETKVNSAGGDLKKSEANISGESCENEKTDKITEDLKKLIEDCSTETSTEDGEASTEELKAMKDSVKEIVDKILQMQEEGATISNELLKKVDEMLQKAGAGGLSGADAEVSEELKAVISDIKNILKNTKTTEASNNTLVNGAIKGTIVQNTPQSGILVDEKNVQASSGQITAPVKEKGQVDVQRAVEQKILDELNLNVDEVIVAAPTTEVAPKATTSASEQLIKLSIEKVSTPIEAGAGAQNSNSQMNNQSFNAQGMQNNQTQTAKAETASAPRFVDVNKTDILNQIGSKFEQLRDGTNSRITLTLRPNDLGRVVIELSHGANGVTTNIVAQNQSVKETLEKNIEGLKQQLAAAGVNVQNINVKTAEFNPQGGGFEDASGQNSESNNQSYSGGDSNSAGSEENSANQGGNFEQEANGGEEEGLITHNGEINYKI